ncbi:MAG TPA: glycoside hydrolase family 20 zincin-like fold domain-containing protein [Verrucomicrobiae bacterium]|nr:glycoside hydrolase family 20 zincin-like fold domain-containing protein [Verrucomicrobiae bacterium]
MNKRLMLIAVSVLLCLSAAALGERSHETEGIDLHPQPKEVTLHEGGFRVTSGTRILVQFGHQSEDRIAAETLAEEIEDESGLQLDIVGTKNSAKAAGGAIVLARLDDRRVREFLSDRGLQADQLADQGYLLFSDKSHLIVAAKSGEGLFYGVQTLRQLLRPNGTGKGLVCPAVTIRDWPNLDKNEARDRVSRESVPEFLKMHFRGPGE